MSAYADHMIDLAFKAYQAGRPAEAEATLRLVACAGQHIVHTLYFIGHLAYLHARYDDALFCLAIAAGCDPDHARTQNDLGEVLRALGRNAEALRHFERAIALEPNLAQAYGNLATVLLALNRPQEALIWAQRSLHHAADKQVAHCDLGSVLGRLGRPREALRQYALAADRPRARYFASLMRLSLGEWPDAWADHELRLTLPEVAATVPPETHPRWMGDPDTVRGKRIMLRSEQGLGDTIQFARYAPLVAALGADVRLDVPPSLQRLLSPLAPLSRGDEAYDLHCPLMSLPFAFRTTLTTVPTAPAYLHAPDDLVKQWSGRLGPQWKRRIGLAWSGSELHAADASRSIPLAALAPLLNRVDSEFHIIQRDIRAEDRPAMGRFPNLVDHSDALRDFTDTAALASLMDLVIAVDTAPLHLAAAIGCPTWALLGFNADWRWLRNRSETPWYPTMRLFRQPAFGDWHGVIATAAAALDRLPL